MENSVVFAKKKFTMDKFLTTAKVSAPSAISKVLSVSARSTITTSECGNGVVTACGKTFVNVVYLNAEGAMERAGSEVEFIEKQQASFELEDLFASDQVSVDSQNSSSTEVMVTLSHNVTVNGVYKYNVASFDEEENDLIKSKTGFNAMRLASTSSDSFVVAEEVESNKTNLSILQADAKVVITDAVCTLDKVVLEGKVYAEVFESDGESLTSTTKQFEFKQEILAEGTTPSMIADANVEVRNITISPEEKEDKTVVSYSFELYAKAYSYEECAYEAVSDMFSLGSEIATKYDYIEAKNYHSTMVSSDSCTLTSDVSSIENLDDVLGVYGSKCKVVSAEDLGTSVHVVTEVSAVALLKVAEEIKVINVSSEVEYNLPKETELNLDSISAISEIASYKIKAGKELEVSANLTYSAKFNVTVSESYVSSFEVIKQKPETEGGIKVYVARQGETLFEVAKALSVKPEVITKQNEVGDVFEQGEKIYIYSPINLI